MAKIEEKTTNTISEGADRYTIKHHSEKPGQIFSSNDLEDAVRIATEKAKHTKVPYRIYDNKNEEIAGIVKPNGEIEREATTVLGRSQNQAVNSGTIRIDKEQLREMVQKLVAQKLGAKTDETASELATEWKRKDPKAMQRDKEKKDQKKHELHEAPKVVKITKAQLAEAVVKATKMALTEAAEQQGTGIYATKIDKFMSESAEAIDKLVEEGEDLMKQNPTHDYAIQERNHAIQARIGILKALKTQIVRIMEDLYKKV